MLEDKIIGENVKRVLNEIAAGNNLGEKITLVAATKTVPPETVNFAISCGIRTVAENRVQEFREKYDIIKGAEQQFIGHLQTNKVKYLVGKVTLIQSVDSYKLAEEISAFAVKRGITQDILIEVNIGGELSKSGFTHENAAEAARKIAALPSLSVKGLMAMLPKTDDEVVREKLCRDMRALYDGLKNEGLPFEHLSIGMSRDYKTAIRNGSNMIRLGSTIFGKRY